MSIKINTIYTQEEILKFLDKLNDDRYHGFFQGEKGIFHNNSLPTRGSEFGLAEQIQFSIRLESTSFFTASDLLNHLSKKEKDIESSIAEKKERVNELLQEISSKEDRLKSVQTTKSIVSKAKSIKEIFLSIIK